ncbi:phosphatase PAP2 family protein [Azospirillum sp. sgz302134]
MSDLDAAAHRKSVALGEEAPALRDSLQVQASRKVLVPVLTGLWAAGRGREEPALSRLARQGLLAILLGTMAAKAGKRMVCRARPNEGGDPSRWGKADGKHASFPSGHATDVAAVATVIGMNRGFSPVTVTSVGFAAAVCWSSMATERHWASDLLAGSVNGIVAGVAAGLIDEWVEERTDKA